MKDIKNTLSRAFHKTGLKIKKHSPEILVITGVVGTVTAAVMACKATTKLNDIIEDRNEKIEYAKECVEKEKHTKDGELYTEEIANRDIMIMHKDAVIDIVKLYAPSVILGAASITCILAGHNITRKRNAALAAAYTAVDKGFKEYRDRVIDRFGEGLDKELRYGVKSKEIEETVVDENGNETTVKKTVDIIENKNAPGVYAVCFDETNPNWTRDAEKNKFFLLQQQRYANEALKAKHVLFLNDIYERIGAQRTQKGQEVGWVYDKNKCNQIDFGIFNIHCEANRNFVNGLEKSVWINPNVEGTVWDKL